MIDTETVTRLCAELHQVILDIAEVQDNLKILKAKQDDLNREIKEQTGRKRNKKSG